MRAVLQGKKLLLLDRVAKSLEWPDRHLHRDLCDGFKLSGVPDPTGVFEADHKPALAYVLQCGRTSGGRLTILANQG